MANQIAKSMSDEEQGSLDNMDMQEMISHVTKNVLGMMNNMPGGMPDLSAMAGMPGMPGMPGMNGQNPFAAFAQAFPQAQQSQDITEENVQINVTQSSNKKNGCITLDEDSDDDESNYIFPKTRDICFDLNVDLEDFYTGKRKKLNVKRKRMIEVDGKQTVIEEKKKLVIPIEKGMKDEQQIRFQGEADQIPGYKPGDIIITLVENENPHFQRDGDNLIMIKNINLYQSYDYTFDIKHLDNTIYRVTNNPDEGLHINDSIRKLPGLGMPSYKSQGNYGDLFIRFNLVIPKTLTPDNLELLKQIFKDDPLFIENKLNDTFDKNIVLENVNDADLEDLEDLYSDSDEETDSEEESEEESESESDVSLVSEESGESEESEEPENLSKKKVSFKTK